MTSETDRALEALLADTAALRQRLRAESAEEAPPPHVDAAILAAARRAVKARPTLAGRSPWRRWQVPLAAAAVLVVASSLTLMVERHIEPGMPSMMERPAGPAPAVPPDSTGQLAFERDDVLARTDEAQSRPKVRSKEMAPQAKVAPAQQTLGGALSDATDGAEPGRRSGGGASPPASPPAPTPFEADAPGVNREQESPAVASSPPLPSAAVEESRPARHEEAKDRAELAAVPNANTAAAGKVEKPQNQVTRPASGAAAPAEFSKALRQKRLNSEEALRLSDEALESALLAIRRLWEGGQEQLARERLAEFLRQHPGYSLPADFPVPRPSVDPFKEKTPEGR